MILETTNSSRILIADDDPVARTMLQALLTKWGYQVIVVSDGLAAARVLESADAPQLAILDWMMPGAEGPEICRRVRALSEHPYVYILLVTGAHPARRSPPRPRVRRRRLPHEAIRQRGASHPPHRRPAHPRSSKQAYRRPRRASIQGDARRSYRHRRIAQRLLRRSITSACAKSANTTPFGVILIDIDHFKRVNDSYGHLVGDTVLKSVAEQIVGCVRPYDTVGRYGGEEFLVVVPLSGASGTMSIAERIRGASNRRPIVHRFGPVHVTISCGVAICKGEAPIEVSRCSISPMKLSIVQRTWAAIAANSRPLTPCFHSLSTRVSIPSDAIDLRKCHPHTLPYGVAFAFCHHFPANPFASARFLV